MSREIRPVAIGWAHPRNPGTYSDGSPRYRPLFSREDLRLHLQDEDCVTEGIDLADYMPAIPEGMPFGWQLYETVSEGTPVSPVCATKDDLAAWLSSPEAGRNRMAPDAAAKFVAEGWPPTFYSSPRTGVMRGADWIAATAGED
jgi:hypothetical protein